MLTEEQHHRIAPYFTNTFASVFGLKLPQEVAGALLSRFSRSEKGIREIFCEEFLGEVQSQPTEEFRHINIDRARAFYARVLDGYGDDSIAQLGGAHLACEGISNLAELWITDRRIGLAPIVKSTRYVRFDKKTNDKWLYHIPSLPNHLLDIYKLAMDHLFYTYSESLSKTREWLRRMYPRETMDVIPPIYERTVLSAALDLVRGFLPASTLTNVGIFATGQAWEHLISIGMSSQHQEIYAIGKRMQTELNEMIPSFMRRSGIRPYYLDTEQALRELTASWRDEHFPTNSTSVRLMNGSENITWPIYRAIAWSLGKKLPTVFELLAQNNLIATYAGYRKNRRDKVKRAFEAGEVVFRYCANLGIYRDLHRHRLVSQERADLTTAHGFDMPPELEDIGIADRFIGCMERAREVFEEIAKEFPLEAQYCVPFAFRQSWYMKMNIREALWICELRSLPQGHRDYRKIAQHMWSEIIRTWPVLANIPHFVDYKQYTLGRLFAEKAKKESLGEDK